MKQLIIFNYGANVAEEKVMTRLTELHFSKLIGQKNIHGIYPMQKDFEREDGWSLAESLSGMSMQSGDQTAHAVVCEYPSRNILEWYETLCDTWGKDRARLYIRITDDLSIHPLIYSYKTIHVNAKELIDDTDKWANTNLIPHMISRLNSFGEYEITLPREAIITAVDGEEYQLAVDILEQLADISLIRLTYESAPIGASDPELTQAFEEDEQDRMAAQLEHLETTKNVE